ncbi:MAG TPA: tetratricopeptide repeat protein [Kofleriaceae bacterium]|nr:tetratricopeptide repeat protein [Kofleriaceae bacterium]
MKRVFISYSADSEEHRARVLSLAQQLRHKGVDATVEALAQRPGAAAGSLLSAREIEAADCVLVVCTEPYRRAFEGRAAQGSGAPEAELIARLASRQPERIVPVLLEDGVPMSVPHSLRSVRAVYLPQQLQQLLRQLGVPRALAPTHAPMTLFAAPPAAAPALAALAPAAAPAAPEPSAVPEPVAFELTVPESARQVANVSLLGSADFVGRMSELSAIRTKMMEPRQGGTGEPLIVIGAAGIGKTALVLQHAFRWQDAYDVIWLVHAQSESTIRLDLALLSRELGLTAPEIIDEHTEVLAVRTWLAAHDRWLLIFDEAPAASVIAPYVPRPPRGHVLVTSRGYDWHDAGRKVLLGALAREASIDLLLRTSGRAEAAGADELAAWLEGHPLMVRLAGALARDRGVSFDVLLHQLTTEVGDRAGRRLEAILAMAVADARQRSPAVLALVELIAYLAPHEIPIRLLREHVEHLAPQLAEVARDDSALSSLLDDLVRLGMVARDDSSLSVHAAVQAAIRATACSGTAAVLLEAAFAWDEERPETWAAAEELLPHVLVAIEDPHAAAEHPHALQRLLVRTAACLWKRGEPARAIEQQRRAIALLEVQLGAGGGAAGTGGAADPQIALANALATLGNMLREVGELSDAASQLEQARALLAAREDAVEVVPVLRALARVTAARGDYEGARTELERALALDRKRLGGNDDLSIAATLSELSGVEVEAGQLDRAARLLEDALAMQRRLLATDDHPLVAATLRRAAAICEERRDLAGARERFERALDVLRRVLHTDYHVAIIDVMNDLARVLMRLGDHLGAQRLLEHALTGSAKLFGGGANPHGAAASYNLARAYVLEGDPTGARRLLERALAGLQTHGMTPIHPTAAAILELLAELDATTDLEAARVRYAQALEIRRELSEPLSPDVLQTTASLARVVARLGKTEEAARLLEPILAHVHEPGHQLRVGVPDALFVTADVLARLGRAAEARDLLTRVLAALRRDGADALIVAKGRLSLARIYLQLEDLVEARHEAREAHTAFVAVHGRGSPADGAAALLRARIALRGDEPVSALKLAARALRVFDGKDEPLARSDAARALEIAGRAMIDLGRRGTAVGLLQRSLERRDAPEVRSTLFELIEELTAAGSPYDLTQAVAFLQRLAPSWLAERVLGAAALESARITSQLEVSLTVASAAVAAAIPLTADPQPAGDYGFRLELASISAEGGAAKVRALAAQARYDGPGRLSLVASTSDLPWGTYMLTVRFVDAARTAWHAAIPVGNEELGNPFLAGPPVRGERFFGRARLLEDLLRHLEDASIVLLGSRRSGKTSVLYRLAQLCADSWTVVIVDLHGYSGLEERIFLRELAGQIARAAGVGAPDEDRPLFALRRTLAAAGTRRVLLLLDEMAVLTRYPDVSLQLRAMSKWDAPAVRVVMAGTLRDVDRLTTSAVRGSSPVNEFLNRELDQLTREEAVSLLERPVLGRYRYERVALDRLLELGAGRPFFLNALAHLTFEVVRQEGARVVTEAHVEAARHEAQIYLARWYRELMGELDDASRAALPAVIEAGGQIPREHAEALRNAGIVVGPRRAMTLDPIFIEWWLREGNR